MTVPESAAALEKDVSARSADSVAVVPRRERPVDYRKYRPEDVLEVRKLPRWVKTALLRVYFLGTTTKKAAEDAGRRPGTLGMWKRAPAAKEWIRLVKEASEDPVVQAQTFVKAHAMDLAVDAVMNLELAKRAGDFNAVRLITNDLMAIAGLKAKGDGVQKIVLQIGSRALKAELPMGESAHEIVEAEIVEMSE